MSSALRVAWHGNVMTVLGGGRLRVCVRVRVRVRSREHAVEEDTSTGAVKKSVCRLITGISRADRWPCT